MRFAKFIKVREEKFGSVVFDTLKEKVYVTNDVGGQILKLIEQGKTQDEIIEALKDLYSEEPFKIESDMLTFIEELKKSNLVEVK